VKLVVEELEDRWVPAVMMPMPAAQANVSAVQAAAIQAAGILANIQAQPTVALPTTLAPTPLNEAIQGNPLGTNLNPASNLLVGGEQYLPGTLVARFGFVDLVQRDPSARLAVDILLAGGGGDETPTPLDPRVLNLIHTVTVASNDDGTSSAADQGDQPDDYIPADLPPVDPAPADAVEVMVA
jgi:hypothetical protein